MKIGGVGQGTQTCQYALKTTLAVEHLGDGAAHLHEWTAPIVEGDGEHLPGLLGMDSLEANRAIIDAGNGRLIYPGPGEVNIILPPGSIEMPIVKSPSGHPCIVVDEYANVIKAQAGGVKTPIPTLTVTPVNLSTPAKPRVAPAASSSTYLALDTRERSPRNPRVLIVEEQPIVSILFTENGYTVEKSSHGEIIATEANHVNGDIKKSRYAAVWMSMPRNGSTIPAEKQRLVSR